MRLKVSQDGLETLVCQNSKAIMRSVVVDVACLLMALLEEDN